MTANQTGATMSREQRQYNALRWAAGTVANRTYRHPRYAMRHEDITLISRRLLRLRAVRECWPSGT